MAEIYTKSVIKIGDETFRNLPAQVDRDQEVSYDANLKSQQALSTATDAKAKATEAKNAADAAQSTADAAQAKANEAKTAADTAQSTADAAQAAANTAQSTADSATGLATQVQGGLADALESKVVRYDETQLLSEDQMITARGNIEAAPITGTVRYDITQHLTDEQKTKAKTNIGVSTDIDTINDTLENKVVRADKKQNLSFEYQNQARTNINAVNSGEVTNAAKIYIRDYAVLYKEPFGGQTQTLTDAQQQKVRTAISAPNDADVVKVTPQTLTDEQKAQARTNIGAGTGGDGAVLYTQPQNLTDEQKAQARANIGAGTGGDGAVLYSQAQNLSDEQKVQARTNIGVEGAVLYSQAQTLTDEQKSQARTNIGANVDSRVTRDSSNPPSCSAVSAAMPYLITDPYTYFSDPAVAGINLVQAQKNAEKSMTNFGYYIDSQMIYQMSSTVVQNVDDYTVLDYTFDASANKNYDLHYFLIFNTAGIYGSNTYVDLALSAPESTSSYNTMVRLPITANTKLAAFGVHFDRSNKLIKPVVGICNDNSLTYSLVPSFANGYLTNTPSGTPDMHPYGYQPIENYRKIGVTTYPDYYQYIKKNLGYYFKLTFSSVNDDTKIIYKAGIYNYAG